MKISELLAQLPETDLEIQAKQPPPENPEAQKRRRQPENWGNASKFTGPDPQLARKLAAEVYAGGRKSILELIGLLNNPANYKPEYLLHCLGVYGNEKERRLLAKTMTSELANSPARPILMRELQWIASDDVAKALGQYLTDEKMCHDAAAVLTAIGGKSATDQSRKAFPKSTGKCRVTIAQALGVLRDPKAADMLRKALRDADATVGQTAAWALARIGDAQSVDPIMQIADGTQGYARAKATNAVLVLAESLATQGKKAEAARIYTHLRKTRTEKYLQETATKQLHLLQGFDPQRVQPLL